jgi:preprotein translocase subunit Sss1
MAGSGRKLAWFVGIWAMSVLALGAVGFAIRLVLAH